MVDPTKITKFDRTHNELEELILFCVCAAGHNGVSSAKALDKFLKGIAKYTDVFCTSAFFMIRVAHAQTPHDDTWLPKLMKEAGIGCNSWQRKARTFFELAFTELNLKTCTVDELEKIHSIGPKTSRFFLVHSRPNANYAVLDRHILHFMKDQGYDVPKSTPNKKQYKKIEQQFLDLAKRSGKSVSQLDLEIWNEYSGNNKSKTE